MKVDSTKYDNCDTIGVKKCSRRPMVNKDTVLDIMQANGKILERQERLGNDTGWQLRFKSKEIICIYDTGKYTCQGKNTNETKEMLELSQPERPTPSKVFVVYGHDEMAKTELEAMLRRWGLVPYIIDQLTSEGATIIEKVNNYVNRSDYGIVLVTPDDEGHKLGRPEEKMCRARQNVVLELGMLLSRLGRKKVAILIKSQVDMEKPSDINGLLYISFKDRVEEAKTSLYKELHAAGFNINAKDL